jgi:hypothetical protein
MLFDYFYLLPFIDEDHNLLKIFPMLFTNKLILNIITNSLILPFRRSRVQNPLMKLLANHIIYYPTPANINYG